MRNHSLLATLLLAGLFLPIVAPTALRADDDEDDDKGKPGLNAATFSGMRFREIGPALMSGRICDFAVDPHDRAHYYAAVCSGNVFETHNSGTTWKPIFDKYGSYSTGCITMDPNNPSVLWLGTGENNSQRSVSFGDGVYKSLDGGASWKNVGLKESEHIGKIIVDPRDSNVVYVAAQGPLWRAGGDRGLYKTADGGETWERILHISDDTGVNEVHMDPRNPDVLYASSYQRRRHTWTLINGGPESNIYKSTDAGKSWRKITRGIPGVDKGRIGMCVSPANPDVVYAIIEAQFDKSGVYRSTDRGETWKKRSSYLSSSPQYYNEIVCDSTDVDRVYSLDTFMHVTEDGGRTFSRAPREDRHVDDHALWVDPHDPDYLLVGSDGGIYESFDRGANWDYKANLPITQFYKVTVDNSEPFYYIYGGTQDNNTLGGPSRTTSRAGITNEDWFVTVGGDGFKTQIDPTDPNIVYSQWQYGGLVRHDRRSGEILDIKPREKPGEPGLRWNWDAPLIISPHDPARLYYAANILFRSDDRGNSWTAVSGDLASGVDRDLLKVMGKVQSIDAVSKNRSTSIYGNAVSLCESPLIEGLIYVGTDDGLIHTTADGGENWSTTRLFPGIPDNSYVSYITASMHDADTVYATFDNHKQGDFAPYVLKSIDRGETWTAAAGDLPDRHIVWSIVEDHEKRDLLFVGTEFGVFFTVDGGEKWIQLKGGVPTIVVKEAVIQHRESDLVLGTFGRGFYVLDDYSPLRHVSDELFDKDAHVFPVKPALRYIERTRLGGRSGRGSQGASFYTADNPPFGATFTYYIKEKLMTREEKRREREKKKGALPYPSLEEMRAEDQEHAPSVYLVVRDAEGNVAARVEGSRNKGIHRASWNLRYPSSDPIRLGGGGDLPPWMNLPRGPMASPGTYTVTLEKDVDGIVTSMTEPQSFEVVPLDIATFAASDHGAVLDFQQKVARLQRAVRGAQRVAGEAQERLNYLRKAVIETPGADMATLAAIQFVEQALNSVNVQLSGDRTASRLQRATAPSISNRVSYLVNGSWYVTSTPTQTQRDGYRYAGEAFTTVLADLRRIVTEDIVAIENQLERAGAPWTPGRIPEWEME